MPNVKMDHYNTRFSGVTKRDMESARANGTCFRWENAARKAVWRFVGPSTIVVGHGVDNDLIAMRWIHPMVEDTLLIESAIVKAAQDKKEAEEKEAEEKEKAARELKEAEAKAKSAGETEEESVIPPIIAMKAAPKQDEQKANKKQTTEAAAKKEEPKPTKPKGSGPRHQKRWRWRNWAGKVKVVERRGMIAWRMHWPQEIFLTGMSSIRTLGSRYRMFRYSERAHID